MNLSFNRYHIGYDENLFISIRPVAKVRRGGRRNPIQKELSFGLFFCAEKKGLFGTKDFQNGFKKLGLFPITLLPFDSLQNLAFHN